MSGRARRATRPTPCLFGASLGLAPTAAFRARMWSFARGAALPFGSLGLASGNTRSRAGVPRVSSTLWQGIARYDGKAAPTRATLHQARSGKRAFPTAEVLNDPPPKSRSSRPIERNDRAEIREINISAILVWRRFFVLLRLRRSLLRCVFGTICEKCESQRERYNE